MTAQSLIRSFGQRIERLNAEIKDLNADKAEVYAEVKAQGLDAKALKLAIKTKAAIEDNPAALQELEFNTDAYLGALMGQTDENTAVDPVQASANGLKTSPVPTRAPAPEAIDPFTGEIIEPLAVRKPVPVQAALGVHTPSEDDDARLIAASGGAADYSNTAASSPAAAASGEAGRSILASPHPKLPDYLRRGRAA